ncbi:uncharacterized protein Sec16 isoform X5 [Epargyreus clarus]|uniref:uncharacterized protein Sec16 isoform X5 n=1 Tax=Epargyreus clarus TaxID=520877 RepID=UPI003C2D86AC
MSWMKGAQGGAPPPGPEQQPYGAPQPYGNQQNMYNNYQNTPANVPQQQQQQQQPPQQQPQMWQMPQQTPQYNQQYGQVYQQQGFAGNANQFYQQPPVQYNQNYSNQNYNNVPQGYQQNYYPPQVAPQQNYTQTKANSDTWEDNWDWGWEDASKQAQKTLPQPAPTPAVPQQQVFNNANVIEESFAATDSWNWSMEDKKDFKDQPIKQASDDSASISVENPVVDNNPVNDISSQRSPSNLSSQHPSEEIRNLSDKDVVKDRLPNLALGKRFHLENLTPQWSIESQMSQESSDGPQTHSEGTYRSENQSRNSSKSSPGLNTDNSNFNYSQSGFEDLSSKNIDWSKQSDDPVEVNNVQDTGRRELHDELLNPMQDMSISNHEIPESTHMRKGSENILSPENLPELHPTSATARSPANFYSTETHIPTAMPTPPVSTALAGPSVPPTSQQQLHQPPANFPQPSSTGISPGLSANHPAPVGASSSNIFPENAPATVPPTSFPSMSSIPPPANFPSTQNPFKHAGPFSHKNIAKAPGNIPAQAFSQSIPNSNLSSPAVVNKVSQQNRVPLGFGANLETTPDNSERPDQPQVSAYRPMPVSQQVPDNLEIAPQNDRNEYLQTAHLSSGDYGENTDFSRDSPLPGLRRMGVGQQDSQYSQNLNISGDEPPPGLARMVPGQQTETDHSFSQSNDNYMDRQIDGQPTDSNRRPYRQADGQQTPDNYAQPPTSRGAERRPIGLDRMVPGEPSNDEFMQYTNSNFGNSNDQRVVTGVDHDYAIPADVSHSDIREQNVDGSDYTDQTIRNPARDIMNTREINDASPDYSAPLDEQQREVTMEGENLQDLSVISSTDVSYSRDPTFDGANSNPIDASKDRVHEATDSIESLANNSRRQSLNRVTSGEDSERDRTFKSSPRRDRDKRKSSRDGDRDRERDRVRDKVRDRDRDKEGRYSRNDRKYDRDPDRRSARDDRRSDKDRKDKDAERDRDRDRRDRGESPDSRRYRRKGHRYETEDTDYYSDKERERRRYREGSYKSSKPPRPEDKERRQEERERNRRYNTIERDRRYDDERDGPSRSRRDERHRDRYERAYRDIDPTRKYGNQRRDRDEDERRRVVTFSGDAKSGSSNAQGESYSSPSRAGSREAGATDEEPRDDRRRARSHRPDPYYDGYGGVAYDPYALQRRQYEYYERLRRTDPAAYMRIYKQLMAGHAPLDQRALKMYTEGYGAAPYEARGEERGSGHSGRSSANGLKGNDTEAWRAAGWRPDYSDRELTTDASLNLHLEESTVRSERMTPFKFSTAHIKGSLSARALVVVRAAYPADGRPAAVQLLPLAALLPAPDLAAYPGPLLKGVTHKKSVMEYCAARVREAAAAAAAGAGGAAAGDARDAAGRALLWQLLALLLRQNGVVVGTDIAELLMQHTREFEYTAQQPAKPAARTESRQSAASGARPDERASPDQPAVLDAMPVDSEGLIRQQCNVSEKEALDRLREYLIYGNRQEALEWALSAGLWGHALALAAHAGRRARAAAAARWLAALPAADPLHTLHAALAARTPPAATCVADERWGDWRPHAAMLLANATGRADHDRRTLTQLGDSLASRGLIYSAQFCYLAAGEPLARHPLAPLGAGPGEGAGPPRLSLLLADPRASTLAQFATNQAIFATEVYEYALSLSQDYVINELQVYKLLLAARLTEAGQCERALGYVERAARALLAAPRAFPPALAAALAHAADRLKYYDPALQEGEGEGAEGEAGAEDGDSGEPSPRHQQWLADVEHVARALSTEVSQHTTPQHRADPTYGTQQQYSGWGDQTLQQYPASPQQYPEPADEAADYNTHYYAQPPAPPPAEPLAAPPAAPLAAPLTAPLAAPLTAPLAAPLADPAPAPATLVPADEAPAQHYNDYSGYNDYWQQQDSHYGYNEPERPPLRRRRPAAAPQPAARPPAARPPAVARPPRSRASSLASEPDEERPPAPRPRPRCGALLAGTVDAWALRGAPGGRYKPLVFGGTYPIDEPLGAPAGPAARRRLRETVERSLDRFERLLARRRPAVPTFAIDEPAEPTRVPASAMLRERDAKYYVAGPKTFDIDEPVYD